MRRNWMPDELLEGFSFCIDELVLLNKKNEVSRLGFGIIFKFFKLEARFPESKKEIPKIVINYISEQLHIDSALFEKYSLKNRTYTYHKKEIRKYFGFREATLQDGISVQKLISKELTFQNFDEDKLKDILYAQFRKLKVEPPTIIRIDRILSSIKFQWEEGFFDEIYKNLPNATIVAIDRLLNKELDEEKLEAATFADLRKEAGGISLKSIFSEIDKLKTIRELHIFRDFLKNIPHKTLKKYKLRIRSEDLREIRRHPDNCKYSMLAIFFYLREREITDNITEIMIQIIHKINIRAERKASKELLENLKKVKGKMQILFRMAELSLENPDGVIKETLYPEVKEDILQAIVKEFDMEVLYNEKISLSIRRSYNNHYRRMLSKIFKTLEFKTNSPACLPILEALDVVRNNYYLKSKRLPLSQKIPVDNVIKKSMKDFVIEKDANGDEYINKINYEIGVLASLRDKLRCREVWVVGAFKYRNPDEDLPSDFEENRLKYYSDLNKPLEPDIFVAEIRKSLSNALKNLNTQISKNQNVKIITKNKNPWIKVSPIVAQQEPSNISKLKAEVLKKYEVINLLDILKETDFRLGLTQNFKTLASYERLDSMIQQKRLILVLYALGTNAGLKNIAAGTDSETYKNLLHIKRKFITAENLHNAIATVVNAILEHRSKEVWGEATTTCASDSKKFAAWDQNILTEYHARYKGYGVMIYWHVEKKSTCIYSQLKRCSSSEVSSMIDGLLRHATEMDIEKNYVDTHGQSEIAFAFCYLLGFKLMPRLKSIYSQKLYRALSVSYEDFSDIQSILTRPINWDLIEEQYDQMIKYATALRLGSADTESILKRFTRNNLKHPTYKALAELGKAVKSIFLTEYLNSEKLRQEINEGLNVVENWNSANSFIFYGKGSEFSSNRIEEQELSMLCMHLLQNSLVYINTLIVQNILSEENWMRIFTPEDFRALTPLFYQHVNPYGNFELNMDERLFEDF